MKQLRYAISNQKKFEKLIRKLKKRVEKLSFSNSRINDAVYALENDGDKIIAYLDYAIKASIEAPKYYGAKTAKKCKKIESLLKEIQNIVYDDIPEEEEA